jgi:hypothetical protein
MNFITYIVEPITKSRLGLTIILNPYHVHLDHWIIMFIRIIGWKTKCRLTWKEEEKKK